MKVLVIGSLNLDYVYDVDHIITPGETESTGEMNVYLGGKGINQSIALAKAGVEVWHAGLIGYDGRAFLDACDEFGVHKDFIKEIPGKTGHTIIQVDSNGQNSILLYGGANQKLSEEYIDSVLSYFEYGDILLVQNEVNMTSYMVDKAYEKGMRVILNPSPFNKKISSIDLNKVSVFLVNEVEGSQITGKIEYIDILTSMENKFPNASIVITLGSDGAYYSKNGSRLYQPIYNADVVDTTAAGDTFTGYFISGLIKGLGMRETLNISSKASSIAVSRKGAIPSIPYLDEVLESMN